MPISLNADKQVVTLDVKVRLRCPYCGNQFVYWFSRQPVSQRATYHVVLCDIEESPGCDRRFVVALSLSPQVETFRIVGETAANVTGGKYEPGQEN